MTTPLLLIYFKANRVKSAALKSVQYIHRIIIGKEAWNLKQKVHQWRSYSGPSGTEKLMRKTDVKLFKLVLLAKSEPSCEYDWLARLWYWQRRVCRLNTKMIYWTEEKQLQIESLLFIYAETSYFRLHDKNVFFFLIFFFYKITDYLPRVSFFQPSNSTSP